MGRQLLGGGAFKLGFFQGADFGSLFSGISFKDNCFVLLLSENHHLFLFCHVFLHLKCPQILSVLDQNAVWIELLSILLAFEELRGRVPSDGHFRVDSGVERFSSGAFGATLLT